MPAGASMLCVSDAFTRTTSRFLRSSGMCRSCCWRAFGDDQLARSRHQRLRCPPAREHPHADARVARLRPLHACHASAASCEKPRRERMQLRHDGDDLGHPLPHLSARDSARRSRGCRHRGRVCHAVRIRVRRGVFGAPTADARVLRGRRTLGGTCGERQHDRSDGGDPTHPDTPLWEAREW